MPSKPGKFYDGYDSIQRELDLFNMDPFGEPGDILEDSNDEPHDPSGCPEDDGSYLWYDSRPWDDPLEILEDGSGDYLDRETIEQREWDRIYQEESGHWELYYRQLDAERLEAELQERIDQALECEEPIIGIEVVPYPVNPSPSNLGRLSGADPDPFIDEDEDLGHQGSSADDPFLDDDEEEDSEDSEDSNELEG